MSAYLAERLPCLYSCVPVCLDCPCVGILIDFQSAHRRRRLLRRFSSSLLFFRLSRRLATPDIRLERIHSKNNTFVLACIFSGHSALPPLGFYHHIRNSVTDIREYRTLFTDDPVSRRGGLIALPDCVLPNGKKCSGHYQLPLPVLTSYYV